MCEFPVDFYFQVVIECNVNFTVYYGSPVFPSVFYGADTKDLHRWYTQMYTA